MMTVSEIWTYPVKGLRGVRQDTAVVEPWGLAGDRRWMVVDAAGDALTQREAPGMARIVAALAPGELRLGTDDGPGVVVPDLAPGPDTEVVIWGTGVRAALGDPRASAWLSAQLGVEARLVHMADPRARPVHPPADRAEDYVSFADGFPLLGTTEASLADLNGRLQNPVPMTRFRPNIVVAGGDAWSEDGWRVITAGAVRFHVNGPCRRCVVTAIDQASGLRPDRAEPLRTLGRFRRDAEGRIIFGQNLSPLTPGVVRVGDAVTLD